MKVGGSATISRVVLVMGTAKSTGDQLKRLREMYIKALTDLNLGFSTKAVYTCAKGVLGFVLIGNILFNTLSQEELDVTFIELFFC